MKTVNVKTHRRIKKNATVKAHVRKFKTAAEAPGAGGQIKAKVKKVKPVKAPKAAAAPKAPTPAAPAKPSGFVKHKKGSPEAAAHMAKIRAMRGKK